MAGLPQRIRVRVMVAFGTVLGAYLGYLMTFESGEAPWVIAGVVAFIAVGSAAWGMWRFRRWGLWLGWAVALAALGLGCFGAWFSWDFWLTREPTLWDRLAAVSHPRVSLMVLYPSFWLIYFTRPQVRAQFRRST